MLFCLNIPLSGLKGSNYYYYKKKKICKKRIILESSRKLGNRLLWCQTSNSTNQRKVVPFKKKVPFTLLYCDKY